MIPLIFNISVWNGWDAYATFTEENDGWVVTALDVRSAASSLLIFNEHSPTNWTQNEYMYPEKTAVIVSALITRAGNYYVLNLLLPLLVIVFVATSTIFMPVDGGPEKPELLVKLQFFNCQSIENWKLFTFQYITHT